MKRRVIIAIHDVGITIGDVFKWLDDIKYDDLWGYGIDGKCVVTRQGKAAYIDITGKSIKIDIREEK